jgi:site-specific DNA-methyltransferase (adenine-specific)
MHDGDIVLHHGDCIEVMHSMPADSVDAVVCDPPYGIGFMGKPWDGAAIREAHQKDMASRKSLGPESDSRPGRKQGDVAILRDRSNGTSVPLTITAFRERQDSMQIDLFDGCRSGDTA